MAKYYVQLDDREIGLEIRHLENATVLLPIANGNGEQRGDTPVDFVPVVANPSTGEGLYSLIVEGNSYQVYVERGEDALRMVIARHRFVARVLTEREWRLQKVAPRQAHQTGQLTVAAPMPGLVKAVRVAPGDQIAEQQKLVVLEAMKMENEISAPRPGLVRAVHVTPGTTVEAGKPLVTLE